METKKESRYLEPIHDAVLNIDSHPMKNSLKNKLDLALTGIILLPGYAGVGMLIPGGGWLHENIRNISLGMIAWSALGAGIIYFTPKLVGMGHSFLLGVLEDIDKVVHH